MKKKKKKKSPMGINHAFCKSQLPIIIESDFCTTRFSDPIAQFRSKEEYLYDFSFWMCFVIDERTLRVSLLHFEENVKLTCCCVSELITSSNFHHLSSPSQIAKVMQDRHCAHIDIHVEKEEG